MSCQSPDLFALYPTPLQIVSGVDLDNSIPWFQINETVAGVTAGIDLTGHTATLMFWDSANTTLLSLTSEGMSPTLTLNADGEDGKIVPIADGATITALSPRDNRGDWELAVFDSGDTLIAGVYGKFKYYRRRTA